jgi:hypothetical protein
LKIPHHQRRNLLLNDDLEDHLNLNKFEVYFCNDVLLQQFAYFVDAGDSAWEPAMFFVQQ